MTTESVLKDWRYGPTQAERLVAGLLYIEGFKRIDPQQPLGGPDGKKDIICYREDKKWVGAVFFPTTETTFSEIKAKFKHDLLGVGANDANGIAFFVNRHLTQLERRSLLELAPPDGAEIFHLERIRALLDSPRGCGLRLEHLRIPMTEAEQWAFWQSMNSQVMQTLVESDRHIRLLHEKMDLLLKRTQSLELGTGDESSCVGESSPKYLGQTRTLTVDMLLWIHRLVTDATRLPEAVRGKLRSIQVWIAGAGQSLVDARYVPPPPDEIPDRLEDLLKWWRDTYPSLINSDRTRILTELARFHHRFLSLHPFADANGRVARAVIDQAAHELLGMRIGPELGDRSAPYYDALERADAGDLQPLVTVLTASLSRE